MVKVCQNSNRQPRQQARQPRLQIEERSERIDPSFAPSFSSVYVVIFEQALCPTAACDPVLSCITVAKSQYGLAPVSWRGEDLGLGYLI